LCILHKSKCGSEGWLFIGNKNEIKIKL